MPSLRRRILCALGQHRIREFTGGGGVRDFYRGGDAGLYLFKWASSLPLAVALAAKAALEANDQSQVIDA